MSLKHKKKVYLSLNNILMDFVNEQSDNLGLTKSKYISTLLLKEYEAENKKIIDKIIEGSNNTKNSL